MAMLSRSAVGLVRKCSGPLATLASQKTRPILRPYSNSALQVQQQGNVSETPLGLPYDGETYNSYFSLLTASNQALNNPHKYNGKGVVESRRIEVNGADLHYEVTGRGDNHVLLLPGSLGSTRIDFGPQLRGFDKDAFTLVALDPRGFGKSIPPERDWSMEFFERDALDAIKLMEMMRVQKFSVLGYEDGGTTALKLAAKVPTFVDKLIVWGTSAYITEYDLTITNGKWTDGMKLPVLDCYGEEYFNTNWNHRMQTLRQYYTDRRGDLCVDDLHKVKSKTLILHGDKDPILHSDHPEFLKSSILNSKLEVIDGGSHKLHLSNVEQFNDIVQDFLKS